MDTFTKSDTNPAASVAEALAALRPITHMWHDGLTVIALQSGLPNPGQDYLTLDEATAEGAVEIQEAGARTVPSVDAKTGPSKVLILGGDTIVGGAQNRIINITVLLKAAATTSIPVSCLEAGRWNSGQTFLAARPVDRAMRSMVAEQVTRHARARGTDGSVPAYMADQSSIWSEIGVRMARSGGFSATNALHHVYEQEETRLDDFTQAFPMPPGSRGVAFGLNDGLIGLDLFGSVETLERQWPRLVTSAASALLDRRRAVAAGTASAPRHGRLDSRALDRMLRRASTALEEATVNPSVGEGADVRFGGPKVLGTALVHDGRAIHIALFRPEVAA